MTIVGMPAHGREESEAAAAAELAAMPRALPNVVLRSLAIRDFRNLARVDLDLSADGLALVGENGHGKTNLLEAIYYLQLLRSTRGARDADLVRFGAAGFHVSARASVDGEHTIAAGFERQSKRKKVVVDGTEVSRLSSALGALPSVIFSPRDVALIAGSPSERRRFLDVALALTSRRYLGALQLYRGALARRNAALRDAARQGGATGERAMDAVAAWEPLLAQHGAILWTERARWVAERGAELSRLCAAIGERGEVRMRYTVTGAITRGPDVGATPDADAAREALVAALATHRAHDVRRGLTHAGPHRDELELSLGPHALRLFGSAGQQRTAAIALRLLESATLRDRLDRSPLVLLDDPFAELDARRSGRILELLANAGLGQTILAVPRVGDIPGGMTTLSRFTIVDGAIHGDG